MVSENAWSLVLRLLTRLGAAGLEMSMIWSPLVSSATYAYLPETATLQAKPLVS